MSTTKAVLNISDHLVKGNHSFRFQVVFATSLLATVQKHQMEKFICFQNGNLYL